MIDDALLAQIAECDRADSLKILVKLAERVGKSALRDDYLAAVREENDTEDKPRFFQVGSFLAHVGDPPPMLVDQLIPEKSLVLLSGKPKAGKSFLGLDLIDAVCQNKPVFNNFHINRSGPVCYLGMEDGPFEIANRLLARGIRQEDTRDLHVCTSRFSLSAAEGLAELEAMIAPINPVLVVVDTAREGLGIRDWNDMAQVSDAVRPLRDFARRNCSVMLIAHNRKAAAEDSGDEIAGSNAFTSSVDGWISAFKVEKMSDGNRRLHLAIAGRGGMRGECIVEMDTHTTRFSIVTDEELTQERTQQAEEARQKRFLPVVAAVRELGGKAIVSEIAERLGFEYETTRQLMVNGVKEGFLRDTGEKRTTEGAKRPSIVYAPANE